jgi:hypothetical protein
MQTYLAKGNAALKAPDLKTAQKYFDLAEIELGTRALRGLDAGGGRMAAETAEPVRAQGRGREGESLLIAAKDAATAAG